MVAQMFIYGSSLKAALVAIVVPDAEVLLPWAKEKGIEVPESPLWQAISVNGHLVLTLHRAILTHSVRTKR